MSDRHVIDDPALAPGFTRPTELPAWLVDARKAGPAVIIMSRLHEADLLGSTGESLDGYDLLNLPLTYGNNLAHSSGDSGSEG